MFYLPLDKLLDKAAPRDVEQPDGILVGVPGPGYRDRRSSRAGER